MFSGCSQNVLMVSCGYSLGSLEGLVSGGSCEPLGSFGFCGSFWFRGSFVIMMIFSVL